MSKMSYIQNDREAMDECKSIVYSEIKKVLVKSKGAQEHPIIKDSPFFSFSDESIGMGDVLRQESNVDALCALVARGGSCPHNLQSVCCEGIKNELMWEADTVANNKKIPSTICVLSLIHI